MKTHSPLLEYNEPVWLSPLEAILNLKEMCIQPLVNFTKKEFDDETELSEKLLKDSRKEITWLARLGQSRKINVHHEVIGGATAATLNQLPHLNVGWDKTEKTLTILVRDHELAQPRISFAELVSVVANYWNGLSSSQKSPLETAIVERLTQLGLVSSKDQAIRLIMQSQDPGGTKDPDTYRDRIRKRVSRYQAKQKRL